MAKYTELLDEQLINRIYNAGYELHNENNAPIEGINFSFKKIVGDYLILLNIFLDHDKNEVTLTTIDLFEEEIGVFPAYIDAEGNVSGLRREPNIIVDNREGDLNELFEEWDKQAVEEASMYNEIHENIVIARKYSSVEYSDSNSETFINSEKIGRNDPCPCESGKKYKYCHGANK